MFVCSPVEPSGPPPAESAFSCLCHGPAFTRLNAVLSARFSRRALLGAAAAGAAAMAFAPRDAAARVPAPPATPVAFTNLRLFDGRSDSLRAGLRVVVEGQRIRAVEADAQPLPPGIRAIDCGGRTLMPGLIDAHTHIMLASVDLATAFGADAGYLALLAGAEAERTLMRGFTSIRDLAGPAFGLKRAIARASSPGRASGPAAR